MMKSQHGVTLVELVILMLVLGIIAVPLANGFLSVSQSILVNEEVIAANNLTQACAEHLLYQRRTGTKTFTVTDCNNVTGFSGAGSLLIAASDSSTNSPLCPAPISGLTNCDEITITASNSDGQIRSTVSLFFIYNP